MGVNGAHNTIEGNVGTYNTVCVRAVAEYCSCRRTGYSPWYHGLTCAPCPALLHLFPSPFRAGVPGRLVPVGSGCASRRRAVSRASAYPGRRHEVGVESSALARPSGRRGCPEAAGVGASAPVGEVDQSQKTGAAPLRPDLPVGDWIVNLDCCSGTWAGP